MNVSKKSTWTAEDEAFLRESFASTPNRELARKMGRTVSSIQMKANRLGLVKEVMEPNVTGGFENRFETMSREDALKLDKADLLAINWSLLEMFRRELSNPELNQRSRVRLMVALSEHTATINSIMKGYEEKLGAVDDLEASLAILEERHERNMPIPRRLGRGPGKTIIVRDMEFEALGGGMFRPKLDKPRQAGRKDPK